MGISTTKASFCRFTRNSSCPGISPQRCLAHIIAKSYHFRTVIQLSRYTRENIPQGLTFLYGSDGVPISYCRAKRLIYITTSGGYIGGTDFGFEYIKTVTKSFFGIENFSFFSAEGLDILGNNPAAILKAAQEKIEREL